MMSTTTGAPAFPDGVAFARAGSGIVYDSEPEREYGECLTKLQNAWRALLGPEDAGP